MAELTDEERAALILEGVEDNPDETPIEQPDEPDEADQPGGDDVDSSQDDQEEPETPETDETEEPDGTFTKQFPNLKGDSWESYGASLEEAYDNSFKEGLRLYEENKQLKTENQQLKYQAQQPVQQPVQPDGTPAPQQGNQPQPPVPAPQADAPDWAVRAIERDRQDMIDSFDPFKKDYPQVLETQNFEAFKNASDGVKDTLTRTLGRAPSWSELFNGVAGLLGWQPAPPQNRKNAAIKDAASSSRSANGPAKPAPKAPKVSDDQVNVYLRMYPGKSKEEAIKDLSEVV